MSSTLEEEFQGLGLSQSDFVVFEPTDDKSWISNEFDNIPPVLIRVSTPKSAGTTNEYWVKSRDATLDYDGNDIDIFVQPDRPVAHMLNRHFRWWGKDDASINVVSWTSSWLFALQYIFYLHKSTKDSSSFDDIMVCVIDTTKFPRGCFVRDMDLIDAYGQHDPGYRGLQGLGRLRSRSYYFGEYASQGALKVEGKCAIVSARSILDSGLYTVQPEFRACEGWPTVPTPPWANEVIRLRNTFRNAHPEELLASLSEIDAAVAIGDLFGSDFRVSVTAGILGILPRRDGDILIRQAFRAEKFTDAERQKCCCITRSPSYDDLPEVNQAQAIVLAIYRDYCDQNMERLMSSIRDVEAGLRSVTLFLMDEDLERAETLPQPEGYQGLRGVSTRLQTIEFLAGELQKTVQQKLSV